MYTGLGFNWSGIAETIFYGLGKIMAGILVLTSPLLYPQVATLPASATTTPPAQNLWHVQIPSDLDIGGIVSALNPAASSKKTPPVSSASPAPTQTPRQKPAPAPAPAVEVTPPSTPAPEPAPPPLSQSDLIALNTTTRAAVVNVLCVSGGRLQSTSGSGVIVDPRGVILTNAHVAQFFLLRDYPAKNNVQCVIRVGSPARALYTAKLLYLSRQWIAENANQITSSAPSGTGENDYAFLLITGRTDGTSSLPAAFSYLQPSTARVSQGDTVLLGAYPASFLGGATIETSLYSTTALSTVQEVYAFHEGETGVDLFSLGGTVVSQGGSSGGAAVRQSTGALAGIFVTAIEAETTGGSDIRALSLSHIDNSLRAEGEGGLSGELSGDLEIKARLFNENIAPALTRMLEGVLGGSR